MPPRSKKQQAFIFANPEKFGGKKNVDKEWALSGSAYDALPDRVSKKKKESPKMLRHVTRPRS